MFLKRVYKYIKRKCEAYTTTAFIGRQKIVECARGYEEAVNWNIAPVYGYNPVVKLRDGYLISYVPSRDATQNAESTIELTEFCHSKGIEFMYLNFPTKVCISEDSDLSDMLYFANQNADRFLAMLDDAVVRNYDFRKLLHEDGMNHHEASYVTEHYSEGRNRVMGGTSYLEDSEI